MKSQSGFTLVELAIVLVIIGLIVGGVLVGRDLIRTAELRSIITDKEKIEAAVTTFRAKYNATPGDMRNATDIWGEASPGFSNDPTCHESITGPGPTCNGNGDHQLNDPESLIWHHLGNANLYAVNYVYNADGAIEMSSFPGPGWLEGGYYLIDSAGVVNAANPLLFAGNYTSTLSLSAMASDGSPVYTVSANDMLYLDQKFDDGAPATGQLVALKGGNGFWMPNCATTNDPTTAEYNTGMAGLICSPLFRNLLTK